MAIAADLVTRLTMDTSGLTTGIKTAQSAVSNFSSNAKLGMLAVAAVITGSVISAFHGLSAMIGEQTVKISELVHSAQRLGVGVEGLQALRFAAQRAGLGTDQLNTSLKFLEKNLGNISLGLGGKTASKYLAEIGLSAKDLINLSVDKQFLAISDAIKTIPNPAEQTAIAIALLGRGGAASIGLLKSNLSETLDEFDRLGIGLTTTQAKAVETYGEKTKVLTALWEGFKAQLTVAVVPALTVLVTWIQATITNMGGIGPVVKIVGDLILSTIHGFIYFVNTLMNVADLLIIKFETLAKVLLRVQQISTLGLSNVIGTHSGDKIAELNADIAQRQSNVNSRNGGSAYGFGGANPQQPPIQIQIQAGDGFMAKVANSPENKQVIVNTANDTLNAAARGEQR